MADRAPTYVTIHECPEGSVSAVAAVLEQYGFTEDGFPDPETGPWSAEWLGHPWMVQEIRLGIEHELGPKLEGLGCAFAINQSGKYEYDGVIRMHAPHLGTFEGLASNHDGHVLVSAENIDAATGDAALTTDAHNSLLTRLNQLTGKAWRDYFQARAAEREAT